MPRKNPLPERELQICNRVKLVRVKLAKTRVEFGRMINLDSTSLANIERGKSRLRFYLAKRIGEQFGVSMKWLAEEEGTQFHYEPVADAMSDDVRPFSQVYDEIVGPELARRAAWIEDNPKLYWRFPSAVGSPAPGLALENIRDSLKRELHDLVGSELKQAVRALPPGLRDGLRRVVLQAVRDFMSEYRRSEKSGAEQKKELASLLAKSPNSAMTLPQLLAKVESHTRVRGMKSELARFMGVPLSTISHWLAKKRSPSGEATLRLLTWVQQPGRKK